MPSKATFTGQGSRIPDLPFTSYETRWRLRQELPGLHDDASSQPPQNACFNDAEMTENAPPANMAANADKEQKTTLANKRRLDDQMVRMRRAAVKELLDADG